MLLMLQLAYKSSILLVAHSDLYSDSEDEREFKEYNLMGNESVVLFSINLLAFLALQYMMRRYHRFEYNESKEYMWLCYFAFNFFNIMQGINGWCIDVCYRE